MYHTPPPPSPPPSPPPPSPPPSPPPPRPPPTFIKWPLSGFKFSPSDKELVVDYLDKKIKNLPLPCDFVINEVMLYHYTPDHLAALYEDIGDNEWYFFTPRDKKYKLGKLPNRAIAGGDGCWKASGAGRPVRDKGVVVGFERTLVFYRSSRKSGSSLKTNWLMNEYYMDNSQSQLIDKADKSTPTSSSSSSMRLDWALCRVYYNRRDHKKGGYLPSCISPQQPLSSAPSTQKWSDFAPTSGDSSQTSPMYSEDYKQEGASTISPQLVSSELPQKWSDSASTSGDCRQTSPMYYEDCNKGGGASTIFPQLIPSELPQKCSDSACTSGDFKQPGPPTPPRVLDYGGGKEDIDTKEEIKSNDLMRAPEPVLVSASSDTGNEMLWLEEFNQLIHWSPPKMFDF